MRSPRRLAKAIVPRPALDGARRLVGLRDEQWFRVVMNRDIERRLASLSVEELSVAEISGTTHRDRPWRSYAELSYPEFDLTSDDPLPGPFDLVICEQVLEHVTDPFKAVDNLYELLRPGGRLLVSTPFLVKIHEEPGDYWRFTPQAMHLMLERAGFCDIEVRSWGNRHVVAANLEPGWRGSHRFQSLRNEPALPVVVWAMPRRPG